MEEVMNIDREENYETKRRTKYKTKSHTEFTLLSP